jgi:hypothetical protein
MRKLALIALLAASFSAAADTVQLRENAPDRHVVVKGDTLWDISAEFLKSPWRWPELWQNNKDRIKNPHWIYPGDVIYLIMTPQGPRLTTMETVKLSPSIHSEPIPDETAAITTIPQSTVDAFFRRPLVASVGALASAPVLIGAADERTMMTVGDRVYASGVKADTGKWDIVRVGKPLKDPDSGEEIAREVIYVGDAKTVAPGTPTTLAITGVDREVQVGDLLMPATEPGDLKFIPHAPKQPVEGKIISAYGGSQTAGKYSTVIINKGRLDGLELGHVLAIYESGRSVGSKPGLNKLASYSPKSGYIDGDKERGGNVWSGLDIACLKPGKQITAGENVDYSDVFTNDCRQPYVQLPDLEVGHILLFRVFDRVSYGLVMDSANPIYLLDTVKNP